MGDVVPLRRIDQDEAEPSQPTSVSEHREIKEDRASLIQHLSEIVDEQGIREVIRLLEDIRSYQDHPEMIKAFEENDHELVHGVRNRNNNILDLLVDNYLGDNNLPSDMLQGDRHRLELQLHIEHFVLSALRGYQEAVETIRNEIQAETNSVPFIPIDPENPDELKRRLVRSAYGTSAYNLCQVLRAARANNKAHSPFFEEVRNNSGLQGIMTKFGDGIEDIPQAIMDSYQSDEMSVGDFDNYLIELLTQVQHSCDDDLYQKLLYWSPRQTIPATPAPPSKRPLSITQIPARPNEIVLEANRKPYIFEDATHTINTGYSTEIAYAMSGSVIEVEDGAKLNLFMANDNVTVKLMGDRSFVRIDRVTRDCKGIRILGKNGEALTGGANLELGEDVLEKLKA